MRGRRIGALLVALAVGGCGPTPVETGSPSATASPLPSPTTEITAPTLAPGPSATASILPSPVVSQPATPIGVVRIPFAGREMELDMVGEPGVLAEWRAATETDRGEAAGTWGNIDIWLARLTDRELALWWIGTVCDVKATLSVTRERLVVSPVPREGCDAMAVGRGVVLTFAKPVDPTSVALVLEPDVLLPEGS